MVRFSSSKYSIQINGVTQLMMMKSDVLSGFDKVKICTAYKIDNREINYFPYKIDSGQIKAIYKEFLDGKKIFLND